MHLIVLFFGCPDCIIIIIIIIIIREFPRLNSYRYFINLIVFILFEPEHLKATFEF